VYKSNTKNENKPIEHKDIYKGEDYEKENNKVYINRHFNIRYGNANRIWLLLCSARGRYMG